MISVKYNWICGRCQKKYVKSMTKVVLNYKNKGLSYRKIEKITGIPKSTLFDMMSVYKSRGTIDKGKA